MTTASQSMESPDTELRGTAMVYRRAGRDEEAEAFRIAALRRDETSGHWYCPEFDGWVWNGDCTEWERTDLYWADPRDYVTVFRPGIDPDPMGELER